MNKSQVHPEYDFIAEMTSIDTQIKPYYALVYKSHGRGVYKYILLDDFTPHQLELLKEWRKDPHPFEPNMFLFLQGERNLPHIRSSMRRQMRKVLGPIFTFKDKPIIRLYEIQRPPVEIPSITNTNE